ncbi:MAG: hypothetical protein GEV12_20715 [Micromonosporaceae bacterium]|nr:hypothetical protein [Micromonosporaceae bacterium]
MTAQPDPSEVFLAYRPRPGRRTAVLAGAAVLVLGIAGVYVVRATIGSPESTVLAYFAALADRDPAAALRVTAPEVAEPVGQDLISEPVLGAPGYAPPEQVEVTDVRVDGRSAVATVSFTVDGHRQGAALRLRRDDGIADAVRHRWLVVDGFGSMLLREVPERITVNGLPMAAYDPQGPRILPALPGGYQVGVPDDDPLWQPRVVPVRVAPQRATEVDVRLVPRPAVRDEVDRQIVRLLDRCAASAELVPAGCPFGYAVAGSAEEVQWRIVDYPNIGLSPGEELDQAVAVVHTAREGAAMVSGTRRFVGRFEDTVPIPISGMVTISGDTVVFQPGW